MLGVLGNVENSGGERSCNKAMNESKVYVNSNIYILTKCNENSEIEEMGWVVRRKQIGFIGL